MNGLNITRETFEKLLESGDAKSQGLVIYDLLKGSYDCACRVDKRLEDGEKKFSEIDKKIKEIDDLKATKETLGSLEKRWLERRKYDSGLAAMFGIVGGAAAQLGRWIIGK